MKAKVTHKRKDCIGCAACAAVCPKYFMMADDGKSSLKGAKKAGEDEVLEVDDPECAKNAADVCPVNIIFVDKS
jgi:ferredoxin